MPFAAAVSVHPEPAHAIGECLGQLLDAHGAHPELVLLSVTAAHRAALGALCQTTQRLLQPHCLVGVVDEAIVDEHWEFITRPAMVAWAAWDIGGATGAVLPQESEQLDALVRETGATTMLLLAGSSGFPTERFLDMVAQRHPSVTVVGGLLEADGRGRPSSGSMFCNGRVLEGGAVAVVLDTKVDVVLSQGCRALSERFTVTSAEGNVCSQLAGLQALNRLEAAAKQMGLTARELIADGVLLGRVLDDHAMDVEPLGDCVGGLLLRSVFGADPSGALLLSGAIEVGESVRFYVRDAACGARELARRVSAEDPQAALGVRQSGSRPRAVRATGPGGRDVPHYGDRRPGLRRGDRPSRVPELSSRFHCVGGRVSRSERSVMNDRVTSQQPTPALEQRAVSTVRGLSMDMVHRAKSGHQGTAMALSPVAHVLFTRIMRYDAGDPNWPDRDRLVLSCGHASVLLYSYLYLTGFGLDEEDLKEFRQWSSATPGHPEAGHTAGVEVTTGPLGQGVGNAVGMAIAERFLRARFGAELFDHYTYVLASDGDLMEGISHEAASLAGHLGLGRLVMVYDDNHITIDGDTALTFTDDTARRFEAYGWHVENLGEIGEDLNGLEAALRRAKAETERPSLLLLRTHIAYPSPKTDDHATHGYALFDTEIAETKRTMGLDPQESFAVADDVLDLYRSAGRRGADDRQAWQERFDTLRSDELDACLYGTGLAGWEEALPSWEPGQSVATRQALEAVLAAALPVLPGLIGGGADLTGNTGTRLKDEALQSREHPGGRQIAFGVREHAMAAATVGMARHGGVIPFGGTFLVFSDYARPSVRLAALSGAHALFVWSHDSIGVGEDGPTHQPVEQVAALRAIPGLRVFRPADANETAAAFREAIELPGPSALILSRQTLPVLETTSDEGVGRGAYVMVDAAHGQPDVVLIGTGSEVQLCVEAAGLLARDGIGARVVSMPCWELFEDAEPDYQDDVLPVDVPIIAVEAGVTFGWERWADDVVGLDRFGASAPGTEVLERFGFTADNVAERARDLLDALS